MSQAGYSGGGAGKEKAGHINTSKPFSSHAYIFQFDDQCNVTAFNDSDWYSNPGKLVGGCIFPAIGEPEVSRQLCSSAPHPEEELLS